MQAQRRVQELAREQAEAEAHLQELAREQAKAEEQSKRGGEEGEKGFDKQIRIARERAEIKKAEIMRKGAEKLIAIKKEYAQKGQEADKELRALEQAYAQKGQALAKGGIGMAAPTLPPSGGAPVAAARSVVVAPSSSKGFHMAAARPAIGTPLPLFDKVFLTAIRNLAKHRAADKNALDKLNQVAEILLLHDMGVEHDIKGLPPAPLIIKELKKISGENPDAFATLQQNVGHILDQMAKQPSKPWEEQCKVGLQRLLKQVSLTPKSDPKAERVVRGAEKDDIADVKEERNLAHEQAPPRPSQPSMFFRQARARVVPSHVFSKQFLSQVSTLATAVTPGNKMTVNYYTISTLAGIGSTFVGGNQNVGFLEMSKAHAAELRQLQKKTPQHYNQLKADVAIILSYVLDVEAQASRNGYTTFGRQVEEGLKELAWRVEASLPDLINDSPSPPAQAGASR